MKIVLAAINAKYIHSNPAVYSLKAGALQDGVAIDIAEYTINNREEALLEDLYFRRPDVLCFSCYIWNIESVISLGKEYKKLCPDVDIWAGGPEVSYETYTFMKEYPFFTGVMTGEGEETFRELCRYYSDRGNVRGLGDIKGLYFRDTEGNIISTGSREPVCMDDIPFIYPDTEAFTHRIIYYESSRGCPFSCTYCLSSLDKKLRFRSLDLVRTELKSFLDKNIPQVKFIDRTFNCGHHHAMEIWRFIRDNDNGITNFHFEVAADLLNDEEIELLGTMRPGLIQLEIGVQSTNATTLKEIRRSTDLERLRSNVSRIRDGENIHQHLDLIAGLPFEGIDSFRTSFDDIFSLHPQQLQLGFLKVLKGSFIYDNVSKYGLIYNSRPPYEVLGSKWLSFGDIRKIKRVEEMLEVYYNSGQYEVTMILLDAVSDSMFGLFMSLGDYYAEKGYLYMEHSRMKRCTILLEYLKDTLIGKHPEFIKADVEVKDIRIFEESLIYDLYYRENCKSRPEWAVDTGSLKDMTRRYCRNGRLSHIEPFHYRFPKRGEWDIQSLPQRLDEPVWVLFDYQSRDPITHQAGISYRRLIYK